MKKIINKLICKIFGHKNLITKEIRIKGYKAYYSQSNWWNCMRCGECTQRLYFSGGSHDQR